MTEGREKNQIIRQLYNELSINEKSIIQVIQLTEEGNTVPFIARYRKEMTGSLDEVQIRAILDRYEYIQNLEKRKVEVIRLIQEQGKLTEELQKEILEAVVLQRIEDLYRPYKQKRRTKATIAKEKGLEPFALWLLEQPSAGSIEAEAANYVNEELEVFLVEDVIAGAKDIIAEMISDDATIREWIRSKTFKNGLLVTSGKNKEADEKAVYEMYYDYQEPLNKVVPHRVLAINRGEKEEILKVTIESPLEEILNFTEKKYNSNPQSIAANLIKEAAEDSYKRLIQPSIEREIRNDLTETASNQAIHIFSENLRNLLLQPPLKGKTMLGLDPAYRTGCKIAVVDETGKVLHIGVIYPHQPKNDYAKSKETIKQLLDQFKIELISIGNGTASRETEALVVDIIKEYEGQVSYLIVNEAGASVYSASELARKEFPDLQVEERSAVSIARRVQDPLAELVKIDPKSIGVGQYQHDVQQKKLNDSLTFIVETVVNQVGVNLNTASPSLLKYVSGLSAQVAENIVKHRDEIGKFTSRTQLKKVPRLGAKTYEQSIGFLRIMDGKQPLDKTSIHPESYDVAKDLLKRLNGSEKELGSDELVSKLKTIDVKTAAESLEIGEPTLKDIIASLFQPGRDPRDDLPKPILKQDILSIEDLKPGMELQGTVRNVVDFGAFIDIGVKQDGLVHISKLSSSFVKHPLDVVAVGDIVTVWVDQIDVQKHRIALTMVQN